MEDLKQDSIHVAHLLIIKAGVVDGGGDLYFTNHTSPVNFYDGDYTVREFIPVPFKVGTITMNTESEFKSVTLTMSNITKDFSQMVLGFDLEACEVVLYEISLRKLDNPAFRIEQARGVFNKPKITEENFEVSIEQAHEIIGIKLPRRSYRKKCQLTFGLAPECPYPSPIGKFCDKTKTMCATFGMVQYFGGFTRVADSADVRGEDG